jgi:hypothetical protein
MILEFVIRKKTNFYTNGGTYTNNGMLAHGPRTNDSVEGLYRNFKFPIIMKAPICEHNNNKGNDGIILVEIGQVNKRCINEFLHKNFTKLSKR